MDGNDKKAAELAEMVRQIRERVRESYPEGDASGIALPDLTPVTHARDAALGKVAAIGTVNPRAGGVLNALIQGGKKLISRSLNWHVREQVEFNRAALRCVEAVLEAQSETNRALAALAGRLGSITRAHAGFQQQLSQMEANFRTLLSAQHLELKATEARWAEHVSTTTAHFEQSVKSQHRDFTASLESASREIQTQLWKDFEKIQLAYQSLIHRELSLIRQRASLTDSAAVRVAATATPPADTDAPKIDWLLFAQKFRGAEDVIKRGFERYVPKFQGCQGVLDLGCGRGEFLELMREAGIDAHGLDLSAENVVLCRNKGLAVEQADMFRHLSELMDGSVGGIFCSQVIEHLRPVQVVELVNLCARKLRPGVPVLFETPNPECLAIFATHFYIDPTHVRPVPPALMAFYMEEAGLGQIEIVRLSQAAETMPSIAELPAAFQQQFFNGLDYAISARRVL